jgi:hypothetical protein
MTRLLRFTALAAFLALALAVMTLPSESQPAPKPVVERQLLVSPPPTVHEMVAQADAVIVGRNLPGARFIAPKDGDVPTWPVTLRPFEVITVVRAHIRLPTPGETVAIELLGGQREYPTHIERFPAPGLRPLGVGRLYAIFLAWNQRREMFEVAWYGAIFDITSERVWSLHEHDRRYAGTVTADEFLSDLGLWGWVRPEPVRLLHPPPGFEQVPAAPSAAPPPDHLRE